MVLVQMSPLIHFLVDYEGVSAPRPLQYDDLWAPRVHAFDDPIVLKKSVISISEV